MQEISSVSQAPTTGTVLLYVGTSWCAYCAKTIAAIGEVMPAHPAVSLYKIDGDEEPDILTDVGAKSYPQLLLFREG
ncbi:MAG: thioredoxin family protein, partial [Thermoleophilia bacterium]|nr:thioredoxin family protein [Thermoleophilia bacterium]